MRVSLDQLEPILRCPDSGSPLRREGEALVAEDGNRRYPIVDGVPVLICDEKSLFSVADYSAPTAAASPRGPGDLARRLLQMPPHISRNVRTDENCARFAALLREANPRPRLLVVGGRVAGAGTAPLLDTEDIETVETDVAFGPRTQVVCDAHDLPFADAQFDGVLCQAVLEHVLDPPRVVAEIHRVLRPGGLVYSEVPFMQQVHEGAYDFTRFTQLGHRRLYRRFDEIATGAQGGPGMALAWSIKYYAQAFAGRSKPARALLAKLTALLTFWLKYTDPWLARQPGGLDAASGTFFLGRRRESPVPDREIIQGYAGALGTPGVARPDAPLHG